MKLVNGPKDFLSFKLLIRWLNSGRVGVHPKTAAQAFGHLMQLPQQPQGFGIAAPLAGVTFLEIFKRPEYTAGVQMFPLFCIFHPKT